MEINSDAPVITRDDYRPPSISRSAPGSRT
jgi:hypothetical protein